MSFLSQQHNAQRELPLGADMRVLSPPELSLLTCTPALAAARFLLVLQTEPRIPPN